jgi:hypothetical protein
VSGEGALVIAMLGLGVMIGSLLGVAISASEEGRRYEACRRSYNVYACELKPADPTRHPIQEP